MMWRRSWPRWPRVWISGAVRRRCDRCACGVGNKVAAGADDAPASPSPRRPRRWGVSAETGEVPPPRRRLFPARPSASRSVERGNLLQWLAIRTGASAAGCPSTQKGTMQGSPVSVPGRCGRTRAVAGRRSTPPHIHRGRAGEIQIKLAGCAIFTCRSTILYRIGHDAGVGHDRSSSICRVSRRSSWFWFPAAMFDGPLRYRRDGLF